VAKAVEYTFATDPNHMLGRPGGYLSKASFHDQRIHDDYSGDGSVEVFSDKQGAQRRAECVRGFTEGNPALFGEYNWVLGNVFLRVPKELTPEQARAYLHAAERLLPMIDKAGGATSE